jgi:hypothetical protein
VIESISYKHAVPDSEHDFIFVDANIFFGKVLTRSRMSAPFSFPEEDIMAKRAFQSPKMARINTVRLQECECQCGSNSGGGGGSGKPSARLAKKAARKA